MFFITGVVTFGRGVFPRGFKGGGSMEMLLDTVFLSCEGLIGHGLPPGAVFLPFGDGFWVRRPLSGDMGVRLLVVTLDLPSTSKFGHSFYPKSVGAVSKAVVLSWGDKFGHGYPPGSDIFSSGLPSTSKLGHSF